VGTIFATPQRDTRAYFKEGGKTSVDRLKKREQSVPGEKKPPCLGKRYGKYPCRSKTDRGGKGKWGSERGGTSPKELKTNGNRVKGVRTVDPTRDSGLPSFFRLRPEVGDTGQCPKDIGHTPRQKEG